MKTSKTCPPVKIRLKIFLSAAAICAVSFFAASCGAAGESLESSSGGSGSGNKAFDPTKPYPINTVVLEGKFTNGSYSIAPFADGAPAPTATPSVAEAKKGAKITITINDIPEGMMIDGSNSKVTALDGSYPALSKTNQFTMPAGEATVTLVFMNEGDFVISDTAYDVSLYNLEITKGEMGYFSPPMTTAYSTGDGSEDNPIAWPASVAYSGYSTDGKTTVIDVYPNNSSATGTWVYKNNNSSLFTLGEGDSEYQAFYVEIKVKPQILDFYKVFGDIPAEFQERLCSDGVTTVAEKYQQAAEKSYFAEITRRSPTTNAYLSALVISTVSKEFQYSGQNGVKGSDEDKYAGVVYDDVEAAAGSLELNVIAESEDSNAMVRIDNSENNQAYKISSNTNYVTYANGSTTVSFDIYVQAEDITKTKKYTVNVKNAPAKYDLTEEEITELEEAGVKTFSAEGGSIHFIETKDDSGTVTKVEEVHSFFIAARDTPVAHGGQASSELRFTHDVPATVEVLVVAGGGAGGGAGTTGGGGGGGVIHYDEFTLTGGTKVFPVKIGNGGAVDNVNHPSQNGGASVFGQGQSRLEAPGGGGGGAAPNWDGRAFKGADGGNGGGGACGWNYTGVTWTWSPRDDLNGQVFTSGDGRTESLGRALTVNFHYDGTDKKADNVKTYPVDIDTYMYPFGDDITQTQAYKEALSTDVKKYQVKHAGHAFGRNGGWIAGISDGSGGSGAGTDAWYHTTAGRNSTNAGGQGIMFNTSGQWRWYSAGGPAGYRCWGTIGQGGNGPGTAQSGNGGATGNPGGSGTVVVRWERPELLNIANK
ncbi:MAG: hypothetical protein Ta2F_04350 [Termitinemataceae bacterium]|nr:MAG: hypothetical protein Ta2F_04350 [Termitinemataceae bacterium]